MIKDLSTVRYTIEGDDCLRQRVTCLLDQLNGYVFQALFSCLYFRWQWTRAVDDALVTHLSDVLTACVHEVRRQYPWEGQTP